MEYLAIDGWEEFQTYRGKRAGFILDATDQLEKRKFTGLSMFTRGVLQELRRLRGRSGENILYDIAHISRSIHAARTDRPHLQHAIDTLIARGVLVVTNQSHDFPKCPDIEKEIEKDREIEKEQNTSPVFASLELVSDEPEPVGEPGPTPESVFAKAYDRYPRHMKPRAAEKAWGQAINRESKKTVKSLAEHEDFLYQRVMHYGAVMRRKLEARQVEKRFIPYMASWLNADGFLEDPIEWETISNGNGTSGAVPSKAQQREARIIEQARRFSGNSGQVADSVQDGNRRSGVLGLGGKLELLPGPGS